MIDQIISTILTNGHLCLGDMAESEAFKDFAEATAQKIMEIVNMKDTLAEDILVITKSLPLSHKLRLELTETLIMYIVHRDQRIREILEKTYESH